MSWENALLWGFDAAAALVVVFMLLSARKRYRQAVSSYKLTRRTMKHKINVAEREAKKQRREEQPQSQRSRAAASK